MLLSASLQRNRKERVGGHKVLVSFEGGHQIEKIHDRSTLNGNVELYTHLKVGNK